VTPGTHDVVLTYPATNLKRSLLFYLIPLLGLSGIVLLRRNRKAISD
jgi:hypothetical protein